MWFGSHRATDHPEKSLRRCPAVDADRSPRPLTPSIKPGAHGGETMTLDIEELAKAAQSRMQPVSRTGRKQKLSPWLEVGSTGNRFAERA